jgi:hypothetical protein
LLTSRACKKFVDMREDAHEDWQPPELTNGPMRPKIDKWIARRAYENARLLQLRVEAKAEKGLRRPQEAPGRLRKRKTGQREVG